MPVRAPLYSSGRLITVGIVAIVLALASGWYVVALGWSLAFLLADGWLMAIYSLILLLSPALFTVIAILAFQKKRRAAGWLVVVLGIKWLAVYVYSFVEGGWQLLVTNLPIVKAITTLADEFMVQYRPEQLVMLIMQFDVEPLVLVVMAVLLAMRPTRRRR